jgi:dTDP-4-dehydrorhamnose 3,5-epimerase
MQLEKTAIDGFAVVTPNRFGDARGWFSETWKRVDLAEAGLDYDFLQDNHSFSSDMETIRGLHYQAPQQAR